MPLVVRRGTRKDLPRLFEFVEALAEIEHGRDCVSNSVRQMEEEFGAFKFFVAELGDEVVGTAVFCETYSTWVGKSLYVDDVYVHEKFRRQGIGRSLIRAVAEEALSLGCHRLRWQVTAQNEAAQEIWKNIGAEIDKDIYNCTFDETGIRALVAQQAR